MGRRSKLTPQLQARIVQLLEAGHYVRDICPTVGITEATYYNWIAAGRNTRDQAPTDDEHATEYETWRETLTARDARWLEFLESVESAQASGTMNLLSEIQLIGRGGRILERTVTTRKDGTQVEKIRYSPPRWQALAWVLERRDFDRFGRRVQVDITQDQLERELEKLQAEAADLGVDLGDLI